MEHPSDIARLLQDDAFDGGRLMPAVASGSFEESDALARIDDARNDELARLAETPEARAKKRAAHWRRLPGS